MKQKHQIHFDPSGVEISVKTGTTVLEAAGIGDLIRSDCGGKGVCGKCRVLAMPDTHLSVLTDAEREHLSPDAQSAFHRLACRAQITGDVTVTVPLYSIGTAANVGKTGIRGRFAVDPIVTRIELRLDQCPSKDLRSVIEGRLASHGLTGERDRSSGWSKYALAQIREMGSKVDRVTVVVHKRNGIQAVFEGSHPGSLGCAVDIGTTSVAVYLCDLATGELVASSAASNPQRRYGDDVISRIAAVGRDKDLLKKMGGAVVAAIDKLMCRCLNSHGDHRERIDHMMVAGNTTMQHLFAGMDPSSLGVAPYQPDSCESMALTAEQLGLNLTGSTDVRLFPVISGFVGGDTAAAVLAEGMHHQDKMTLLVDIGTNGEIVLGNRHQLWATSCATGPALEGAQLSCGMRAQEGAIYEVQPGPRSGDLKWRWFGDDHDAVVRGVCGSGMIDLVAALRRMGIIAEDGRLLREAPKVVACSSGNPTLKYVLVSADDSSGGVEISLTQKDIRQIQLAKAALAMGIDVLMKRAGVHRVDRTVLTGAFGVGFNINSAVQIGLLPGPQRCGTFSTAENLAGQGAVMALCDQKVLAIMGEVLGRVHHVDLVSEPGFTQQFSRLTRFPSLHKPNPE